MRRLVVILALLLATVSAGRAQPSLRPSRVPAPGRLCRQAIDAAERAHGIPAGLLAAMGKVESGRPAPDGDAVEPWPWTVNIAGQGAFFDSRPAAVAAVRASQARGVRSIDVGCLQVNLMHHPHAFASLKQAFDPETNVDYAAGFLHDLFDQTGSWPQAAARYHSATPALGAAYRRKVLAAWMRERRGVTAPVSHGAGSLWASARPPVSVLPHRQGPVLRIPSGWKLAMHLPATTDAPPAAGTCPFAAIVACNRIRPKAAQ